MDKLVHARSVGTLGDICSYAIHAPTQDKRASQGAVVFVCVPPATSNKSSFENPHARLVVTLNDFHLSTSSRHNLSFSEQDHRMSLQLLQARAVQKGYPTEGREDVLTLPVPRNPDQVHGLLFRYLQRQNDFKNQDCKDCMEAKRSSEAKSGLSTNFPIDEFPIDE